MIPGARLIILGRQGAGKGTQCVRLSRHYVVPHISTGDMLRAAGREGTDLGTAAKQVMDAGGLVGDEVMIGLVAERLEKADASTRGYILDGFPRTVTQAQALDGITASKPIHVVIDLDVPREIVLERISSRRVCRDCGTNYTHHGRRPVPLDLRRVRWRRRTACRRHPRLGESSARPVRDPDGAVDRVLQQPRGARRGQRGRAPRPRVQAPDRRRRSSPIVGEHEVSACCHRPSARSHGRLAQKTEKVADPTIGIASGAGSIASRSVCRSMRESAEQGKRPVLYEESTPGKI